MCSRPSRSSPPPGFTLLEVMLGVMIIALVTLTIFRFVETNLNAIAVSTESTNRRLRVDGLINMLATELPSIPRDRPNGLIGEPHLFGDLPSDEIAWIAGPGNSLFTRHAPGEYRALLVLRNRPESRAMDLGIERSPVENPTGDSSWLPLLQDVSGFEVRYFEKGLNAWVDKWQNSNTLPNLVRFRIWTDDANPHEVVVAIPAVSPPALGQPGPNPGGRPPGERPRNQGGNATAPQPRTNSPQPKLDLVRP